jgi:hypothetical protein
MENKIDKLKNLLLAIETLDNSNITKKYSKINLADINNKSLHKTNDNFNKTKIKSYRM